MLKKGLISLKIAEDMMLKLVNIIRTVFVKLHIQGISVMNVLKDILILEVEENALAAQIHGIMLFLLLFF